MSKIMQKRLSEIIDNPAFNDETKSAARLLQNVFVPSEDETDPEPAVDNKTTKEEDQKTYEDGLAEGRKISQDAINSVVLDTREWAETFVPGSDAAKIINQIAGSIESKLTPSE